MGTSGFLQTKLLPGTGTGVKSKNRKIVAVQLLRNVEVFIPNDSLRDFLFSHFHLQEKKCSHPLHSVDWKKNETNTV